MNSEVLIMYVNCRTRPIEEMLKDQVEKKKTCLCQLKLDVSCHCLFFTTTIKWVDQRIERAEFARMLREDMQGPTM